MKKVYINSTYCFSSLGLGNKENWESIQKLQSGIKKLDKLGYMADLYGGKIEDAHLERVWNSLAITQPFTRLEKMVVSALKPLCESYGISDRTALVISTTKGNIRALESGNSTDADLNVMARKIGAYFGFKTMPIIVCNACISGLLATITAKRLIQMNQFDDAFVVAADELTPFVVSGFNSFQAMSSIPCKPFDANRSGVTLGEAAAAAYISAKRRSEDDFEILGEAVIADANHISGPSRTGEGLYLSIKGALREAAISPMQIDVISAHGTATMYNDEMESIAFDRCGLRKKPIHSLKGYVGHTLGAAGLLELTMLMESLKNEELIVSKGYETSGVSRKLNVTTSREKVTLKKALKTASGFGGSNAAIIVERVR